MFLAAGTTPTHASPRTSTASRRSAVPVLTRGGETLCAKQKERTQTKQGDLRLPNPNVLGFRETNRALQSKQSSVPSQVQPRTQFERKWRFRLRVHRALHRRLAALPRKFLCRQDRRKPVHPQPVSRTAMRPRLARRDDTETVPAPGKLPNVRLQSGQFPRRPPSPLHDDRAGRATVTLQWFWAKPEVESSSYSI
jgi:hypothetical protein